MDDKTKTYVLVGLLILVAIVIYFCFFYKKSPPKETYSNIGGLDNVGSLDTSYELIQAPEQIAPAAHFADMVDAGDHNALLKQPENSIDALKPLERLDRVNARNLLPRTAASVTPYNIDVANPQVWSFSVNNPRVQLKDPLAIKADFYRGDIPISYHPDVALIGKSQYGRDSIKLDGYFSDYFASLYAKNTGKAFKSMPLKISEQETIMDYN